MRNVEMSRRTVTSLLTHDLYVALTALHRIRVHLTHVPSAIHLLHVLYVKVPRAVVVVGQRDSGILRDHIMMNRQNGLCVDAHPRHLKQTSRDTFLLRCALVLSVRLLGYIETLRYGIQLVRTNSSRHSSLNCVNSWRSSV